MKWLARLYTSILVAFTFFSTFIPPFSPTSPVKSFFFFFCLIDTLNGEKIDNMKLSAIRMHFYNSFQFLDFLMIINYYYEFFMCVYVCGKSVYHFFISSYEWIVYDLIDELFIDFLFHSGRISEYVGRDFFILLNINK